MPKGTPTFNPWCQLVHPALRAMGMDILGPFPQGTGLCKFQLIAIDYFTKWIEVELLACIIEAQVQHFI